MKGPYADEAKNADWYYSYLCYSIIYSVHMFGVRSDNLVNSRIRSLTCSVTREMERVASLQLLNWV